MDIAPTHAKKNDQPYTNFCGWLCIAVYMLAPVIADAAENNRSVYYPVYQDLVMGQGYFFPGFGSQVHISYFRAVAVPAPCGITQTGRQNDPESET